VDIVLLPVLIIYGIKLMAKSPVTLKKELSTSDGYTSQSQELYGYIGLEGDTLTDLRPSGTAYIGGKRLDVIARGEYIEKGKNVVVSAVEGNQVIVKLKA
jgi:membrane-bound serine protease (ClpP class)